MQNRKKSVLGSIKHAIYHGNITPEEVTKAVQEALLDRAKDEKVGNHLDSKGI